jgi:hypothetical protein
MKIEARSLKTEARIQNSEFRSQNLAALTSRRFLLLFILTTVFWLLYSSPAPALDPQSCTITNLRDEADSYISTYEFYRGQTLLLTNCIAYAGTSATGTVQNLTNLTLTVKIGTETTNVSFSATAQVYTAGTWTASFTLPTNWVAPNLWFQLTDTATNVYVYPLKKIRTRASP